MSDWPKNANFLLGWKFPATSLFPLHMPSCTVDCLLELPPQLCQDLGKPSLLATCPMAAGRWRSSWFSPPTLLVRRFRTSLRPVFHISFFFFSLFFSNFSFHFLCT